MRTMEEKLITLKPRFILKWQGVVHARKGVALVNDDGTVSSGMLDELDKKADAVKTDFEKKAEEKKKTMKVSVGQLRAGIPLDSEGKFDETAFEAMIDNDKARVRERLQMITIQEEEMSIIDDEKARHQANVEAGRDTLKEIYAEGVKRGVLRNGKE